MAENRNRSATDRAQGDREPPRASHPTYGLLVLGAGLVALTAVWSARAVARERPFEAARLVPVTADDLADERATGIGLPVQDVAPPAIAAVAEMQRTGGESGEVIDAVAYGLLSEHTVFDWPMGAGSGELASGIGLIAIPDLTRAAGATDTSSHFAIANSVAKPGFTDFVVLVFDQNGLLDFVCAKLNEGQIEYVDLHSWGYINPGFRGSAVVSAAFWEHEVFSDSGRFLRNLIGLDASVVDFTAETGSGEGDSAVGSVGVPLYGHLGMELGGYHPMALCSRRGPPFWATATPTVGPSESPTVTSTPTATPSPTATPTPVVPPPYAPPAPEVHLPALREREAGATCDVEIAVQNVGPEPSKAVLITWDEPSACGAECAGPLAVSCSGLLNTGGTWRFTSADFPAGARSGTVYSFSMREVHEIVPGAPAIDPPWVADLMCETLRSGVVGDCGEYRRFKLAYDRGEDFAGIPQGKVRGSMVVAEVRRRCTDGAEPKVTSASLYNGASGPALGYGEPDRPEFDYLLPVVHAGAGGQSSVIHIQNAGDDCGTIELWVQARDSCGKPQSCLSTEVVPGEAVNVDARLCLDEGALGSAWVRGTTPLAIAVDTTGGVAQTSYTAAARNVRTMHGGPLFSSDASAFVHAPLVYKNYLGWSSRIHVQNASRDVTATLKASFLDRAGVPVSVREFGPLCPGGGVTIDLETVGGIPFTWVGSARIESLGAGGPPVATPWVTPEPSSTPLGTPAPTHTVGTPATPGTKPPTPTVMPPPPVTPYMWWIIHLPALPTNGA